MSRPEDYWIGRGPDLIGIDVLEQKQGARQASTYNAIAIEITAAHYRSVLDVGCNVGAIYWFLEQYDYLDRYLGVDTNHAAVDFINKQHRSGFSAEVGSIRSLPKNVFDCVLVKDVLEHLESLDPAREAFRVASLCVILSFFTPPMPGSESIHQTEHGYYHNRYDENNLLEIATSCGFVLGKRIDTWETDGNMNRTYVFLRGIK